MKIVVSQSIVGKTQEQIEEEKFYILEKLKLKGYEVEILSSGNYKNVDEIILKLSKDLEIISKADTVAFETDWADSEICRLEYAILSMCGKEKTFLIRKDETDKEEL